MKRLLSTGTQSMLKAFFAALCVFVPALAEKASNTEVVPILWNLFTKGIPADSFSDKWKRMLVTETRFVLNNHYGLNDYLVRFLANPDDYYDFMDYWCYQSVHHTTYRIRPPSFDVLGLSIALATGIYDEDSAGYSRQVARAFAAKIAASVAKTHHINGGEWGYRIGVAESDQPYLEYRGEYHWQSVPWASAAALAAWLVWDTLSAQDREYVRKMIENEADRFIGQTPPSWNGIGGDTKAEENAWNALGPEAASAMMPNHPNRTLWIQKAIEYRLNATSRQSDLSNNAVYHGKAVKDWLSGYNLYEDGSVVNHSISPHPDYMGAIFGLTAVGICSYGFAGLPVASATCANLDIIYDCFVDKNWPSPPYWEPGGTIYKDDGTLYWPPQPYNGSREEGCATGHMYGWSFVDLIARILEVDSTVRKPASFWETLHVEKMQTDLARARGDVYTEVYNVGLGYLLCWLKHQEVLSVSNFDPDAITPVQTRSAYHAPNAPGFAYRINAGGFSTKFASLPVNVFDVTGARVKSISGSDDNRKISLPSGVYIIGYAEPNGSGRCRLILIDR